jgi:uncharacterized protein
MRFWDTSALLPLCVDEPESVGVKGLLRHDPSMVVSWASIIECWSALARRRREGVLQTSDEESARTFLRTLQESWIEVLPSEDIRARAGRLLRLHPIRSADAVQLAAALVWAGDPPSGESLFTTGRLREAAPVGGPDPTAVAMIARRIWDSGYALRARATVAVQGCSPQGCSCLHKRQQRGGLAFHARAVHRNEVVAPGHPLG